MITIMYISYIQDSYTRYMITIMYISCIQDTLQYTFTRNYTLYNIWL